jgi:Tfp pilus assembly protein PilV
MQMSMLPPQIAMAMQMNPIMAQQWQAYMARMSDGATPIRAPYMTPQGMAGTPQSHSQTPMRGISKREEEERKGRFCGNCQKEMANPEDGSDEDEESKADPVRMVKARRMWSPRRLRTSDAIQCHTCDQVFHMRCL